MSREWLLLKPFMSTEYSMFTFLYLLYFITKPIEFILKCKENELQYGI